MVKVITSLNIDLLTHEEIVDYYGNFGAENILTYNTQSKTIVAFDIKRGLDITPSQDEIMLEIGAEDGDSRLIAFRAYSDSEEYYWERLEVLDLVSYPNALHRNQLISGMTDVVKLGTGIYKDQVYEYFNRLFEVQEEEVTSLSEFLLENADL